MPETGDLIGQAFAGSHEHAIKFSDSGIREIALNPSSSGKKCFEGKWRISLIPHLA
jgi:hypothetical protein